LIYNRSILTKLHAKYLLSAYPTRMANQDGIPQELYIFDLKRLINTRYIEGMLVLSLFLSKQLLKHFLKSLLRLWWYMMSSILFLSRWDFPFVNNDLTYLASPRFSTSIGMFSIWLWNFGRPFASDVWKLRKKQSKLHVIYCSVLINNWIGMM